MRAIYPDAVVIRPSVIFGLDDGFFNRFGFLSSILPVLPPIPGADLGPVPRYVKEVANADDLFPRGFGPRESRDSYWGGKSLGRNGTLLELAEQLDMTDERERLLVGMENELVDWFDGQMPRVLQLIAEAGLPAIHARREWADAGGLMGQGIDFFEQARRAETQVDKILKGAKPADLPVQQPEKFDFIVNLKTGQALGLTIPQSVLQQATELIQ